MKGSTLTTTLLIDGKEVEEGSVEVVEAFRRQVSEAHETLLAAGQLLGHLPEEIEQSWRKMLNDAERKLYKLSGRTGRFSADYRTRGLESAVSDARFRKDLV